CTWRFPSRPETTEAASGDSRPARATKNARSPQRVPVSPAAALGAILLTGYLGSAVATHVRVNAGLFEIAFPVIFGGLLSSGLWLRDAQLQGIIPLRDSRSKRA